MDAQAIIAIIERHSDRFRDAASVGTGVDTLVASAAQGGLGISRRSTIPFWLKSMQPLQALAIM
jgi:hypothetical protein